MSGDHIISATILRKIGIDKVLIKGNGFARAVAIKDNSLKIRWLCQRHNSALSPLDAESGRLFQAVQSVEDTLAGRAELDRRLYLFEGFDLERWLLKTLFAAYYARISNITPETHKLPDYTAKLFEYQLPPPLGLHVPIRMSNGEQQMMTIKEEAALNLITEGALIAGVAVSLASLELKLLLAGHPNSLQSFGLQHAYRPQFLNFFEGREVVSIAIAWRQGSNSTVWISRGNPIAQLPEDL